MSRAWTALALGVVLAFLSLPLVALLAEARLTDLPELLGTRAVQDAIWVTARANLAANGSGSDAYDVAPRQQPRLLDAQRREQKSLRPVPLLLALVNLPERLDGVAVPAHEGERRVALLRRELRAGHHQRSGKGVSRCVYVRV